MASYGQTLLRRFLEELLNARAVEDLRPPWLEGLELDIVFKDLEFAAEFQGDQHYIPVTGASKLYTQRNNDRMKKAICEDVGVKLLIADAADLEYTRLIGKLNNLLGHKIQLLGRRSVLRLLNKEATAYRKSLKKNFGSPTAYRRANGVRKRARAAWRIANGMGEYWDYHKIAAKPCPAIIGKGMAAARA